MTMRLCSGLLDLSGWLAIAFLVAALVIGIISAIKAFRSDKPSFGTTRAAGAPAIAPLLEALKGVIEALGSAPAWFALFLAGIFLFWMTGETYSNACKPVAPIGTSSTTKSTTTLVEKTIQKGR